MRSLLPSAICIVLAGCAASAGSTGEVVMRLDPPIAAVAPVREGQPILLAPVRASGSASGRRYTYVDPAAPREVRQARTLFWEEPPPLLLDHALARGLSARLGRPVLEGQAGAGIAQRVSVELERFEERSGVGASAMIALRADVIDWKTRGLIFASRYCATSPILGRSPSDRSAAFEAATSRIVAQLASDIAEGGAGHPATGC